MFHFIGYSNCIRDSTLELRWGLEGVVCFRSLESTLLSPFEDCRDSLEHPTSTTVGVTSRGGVQVFAEFASDCREPFTVPGGGVFLSWLAAVCAALICAT